MINLKPLLHFISNHPSMAATGGVLLLFTLKIMAVSHGSWDTAIILLRETSPFEMLISMLLLYLPPLAGTVGAVYLILAIYELASPKSRSAARPSSLFPIDLAVVATVLVAVIVVMPWGFLVVSSIRMWFFFLAILGLFVILAQHQLRQGRRRLLRTMLGFGVFGSWFFIIATSPEVWLPLEHYTLNDETSVVGYALSQSDDRLLVLEEENRKVLVLEPSSVASRTYCFIPGPVDFPDWLRFNRPIGAIFGESLGAIIGPTTEAPDYPTCNDLSPR